MIKNSKWPGLSGVSLSDLSLMEIHGPTRSSGSSVDYTISDEIARYAARKIRFLKKNRRIL
ncbi:MAG: hypothetical protein SFY81_11255 [Verrucomicrobiota bacterium]|nr:hypothetical protein [Verrucomicrobiota bacterium]